ncbi:MAG: hypothetical protein IJZ02_05565, partial [Clostridia bacterium]|nr:hypothetical protein [Clostridia bacterium]
MKMEFHHIWGFRFASALLMAALIILSTCFMLVCTGCSDQTDAPATEPPATEPPVTEPPVTEPPVTEPVSKENFSWRNTSVV